MYYNLTKEAVDKDIAKPFMENKKFWCLGIILQPSTISRIVIFVSERKYEELILPNRRAAVDETDHYYIVHCFYNRKVNGVIPVTETFITSLPEREHEPLKTTIKPLSKKEEMSQLMKSATFLGLDANWSMATCALQLQEVAMTLVARRKRMKLDKANVERVLRKEIKSLSFNDQYEAFSKLVKVESDIEMPILTTHLRKMRAKVLHEGYNPKPEETDSIVSFTIGLLQKLSNINQIS